MPEFWEAAFNEKKEMWGAEPAASALLARDFFIEHAVKDILIPGIGYGRNAQVFVKAGIDVTGIEISSTAITLAKKYLGNSTTIFHGSVTDMPFDDRKYGGIFCHGLIYLLDEHDRKKLIADCLHQLAPGGLMIFTVISTHASNYGQGTPIGKDRFELYGGVKIFFYTTQSIEEEFGDAGLIQISEVQENFPFFFVVCKKA